MSGGHFNYAQHRIGDIADSIQEEIDINGFTYWLVGDDVPTHHYEYPDDILDEFKKGVYILRMAEIYAQRIDWLLSGDDGEDSFRERLKEDLEKLKQKDNGK